MIQKNLFVGLIGMASIFFFLAVLNKRCDHMIKFEAQVSGPSRGNVSSVTIQDIVKIKQSAIRRSLWDYQFPPNRNLRDHLMEMGGQPLRSIIVSTWRSGSSFLGDVINMVPGSYYHYEPLLHYDIIQIRGPPYSESAISDMKNLLNCDYTNLQRYLEFGKNYTYPLMYNNKLWSLCDVFPQYCWSPMFFSSVCKVFPFQTMKTVRLRAWLVDDILKDKNLNVKVLLLIRDPRGIVQSRKHKEWCFGQPDCDKPNLLCADLVSQYRAAVQFQKLYPHRFRVIRYEDLCLDPYRYFRNLFSFFGLFFHRSVEQFLSWNTKRNIGGASTTKINPFHWQKDLNFSEIQFIQENCDEAMKLWGYIKAINKTHLRKFYPLTDYIIN